MPMVGGTAAAPGTLGSAKLPTDRQGFAEPKNLHQTPSTEDLAPLGATTGSNGGLGVCPAGSILLHC